MEQKKEQAQWIWLDSTQYPALQTNIQHIIWPKTGKDCVVEFKKEVAFSQIPQKVILYVSGDAVFRLWEHGTFVGQGPASAGGDFLMKGPISWYYANEYILYPKTETLQFLAQVRLQPQEMTDVTGGQGGFYLWGKAEFADGTEETFGTDSTWQVRVDQRFPVPYVYDETKKVDSWQFAVVTGDTRTLQVAPIPPLCYEIIYPQDSTQKKLYLQTGSKVQIQFDRIYSAHIALRCDKPCHLEISCYETDGLHVSREEIILNGTEEYRSFYMKSISLMEISVIQCSSSQTEIKNSHLGSCEAMCVHGEVATTDSKCFLYTENTVCIEPFLYFSHYPVEQEGTMCTSDKELNLLYDVCKWTLKICRQTLHLDSPKHQELLACSGDYYIESMMTAFTFGDMRLAELDIRRTAQWLEYNHGRMFHTTYSLIWVQWLEFVFQFTGNLALLEDCHKALVSLFDCFETYMGDKGVLENPPDYMFVDWVVLEGYSMHHPPKCLGQTVLNAFYYKALTDAVVIARRMGWTEEILWQERAEQLHTAFHTCFYDGEKHMYIDGLGDYVAERENQPENVPMKHYSRYPNTLAVLYGLCPPSEKVRLVRLVVDEQNELPPVQPYFMHFILQAVCKVGLAKEYGLTLFEKWKPLVLECSKGLQEGWLAPEPGYSFDHSHAWGGTPAYHMPLLLTGFQMLEPGFKKISLSPNLFGLKYADISFPTPYGMLRCIQRQGERAEIIAPEGLNWELLSF